MPATSAPPSPDDALLTFDALSAAFGARGVEISPKTLRNLRAERRGPPGSRWGKHTLFRWADAWGWAQGRADADAQRRQRRAVAA